MKVRGAFNHILRPGLRSDFRDEYMGFEQEWSMILREGTMERAEVEATTISGLPRQVVLKEQEPYTIIDPEMADKIVYTDEQYGLGFSIGQEMMEDDLYDKANQSSKWLARSTRLTQEYAAADFLDDAFTGTYFKGYGKTNLIKGDHALLNSVETWSNVITGNPAFGITGIQAAMELGEQTKDHQGDPVPVRFDTLFINISDEWNAIQILQNKSEPFTDHRNINATMRKAQLSYTCFSLQGSVWFRLVLERHIHARCTFSFPCKPSDA